MSDVRWIHLVSAIVWPASAALGLWRARSLIRRRTRLRVYALMAVAIAVGAENLIQALSPHHPVGPAHLIANIVLAAAGVVALFVLAAYPEEIAHEERVLYALSRRHLGAGDGDPHPARPLSRRELEVLECLCEGLSTDQIAVRLSVSPHTAATHVRNLMGGWGAAWTRSVGPSAKGSTTRLRAGSPWRASPYHEPGSPRGSVTGILV